MAHATHLTIATADRIRLSFPPGDGSRGDAEHDEAHDDEHEIRQEVQVSVTYALDRKDTDLAALAAQKAEEVRSAHAAAWHRIGAFGSRCANPGPSGTGSSGPCGCRPCGKPDAKRDNEDQGAGKQAGIRPSPGIPPHAQSGIPPPVIPAGHRPAGPMARTGISQDTRSQVSRSHYPVSGSHNQSNGNRSNNGNPAVPPAPEFASKPQKILIRSRAQKVGLSMPGLEEVIWKQFRRRSVELLTKSQANAVILALERYEETGRIDLMEIERTEPAHGTIEGYAPAETDDGATDGLEDDPMEYGQMQDDDGWEPQEADAPAYV